MALKRKGFDFIEVAYRNVNNELLLQGYNTLSTNVNNLIGENAALHRQMSFLEDRFVVIYGELQRVKADYLRLFKKRKRK